MQIRESVKRLIIAIVVLALLIFATVAWFFSQREIGANGVSLSAIEIGDVSTVLYQDISTTNEKNWVAIDTLKFENMVSGQILKYKIQLTNNGESEKTIAINLNNITEDEKNKPVELMTQLNLIDISADKPGGTLSPGGIIKGLLTAENDIELINEYTIQSKSECNVLFSIHLNGEAGNEYQERAILIESVDLITN